MNRSIIMALAFCFAVSASPALAAELLGTWLSESGDTKIKIAPGGGSFVGTVVWAKGGAAASKCMGNPVGMAMIYDVKPSGKGFKGKLKNYKDCKTYTGKLELLSPDRLRLAGCVMGGLFCKKQIWTKAD